METRTPFGRWLDRRLRSRDMTPADLARKMGVPNGSVSRWMSGGRRPSYETCERIADALLMDAADVRRATEDGGPLPVNGPGRAVARACERAGLPHLTPHSLRRYHATELRNEGLLMVQRRLGHSRAEQTSAYVETRLDDQRPAVERLEERLRRAREG